ncbi:unnamed protein product, partial [Phaeothamnion confervicola]
LAIILLVLAITLLSGCGESKIDASSNDRMKVSVQQIQKSLPQADQKKFENAARIVSLNAANIKDAKSAAAGNRDAAMATIRRALDGKTAAQVIEEADRIRAERQTLE